jgi:hypothetical protein
MLKNPARYERFTAISRQGSPASLLCLSAGNSRRPLVDESGMIRTQMGDTKQISNGRSAWDALCDTTS